MTPVAVCSIAAKADLPLVRVLAGSVRQHHPDWPVFVLLADEPDAAFTPAAEPFAVVRLSELDAPRLTHMRFWYTARELSYALTPFLMRHLLRSAVQCVAFIKQESLVVGDLSSTVAAVDAIGLTPHLLTSLPGPDGDTRERNILLSGVFNAGFVVTTDSATGRTFLDWWADRLTNGCRHAVGAGLHFEQRWLDLVPSYFPQMQVIRDTGVNVGHWNLPERRVEWTGETVTVDGVPGRLVRFSGYDPDRPHAATRYNDRLSTANLGAASVLFDRYRQLLLAAGYRACRQREYAFSRFDNGVPVPEIARRVFAYLAESESVEPFGDPLVTAQTGSFFRWLTAPIDRISDHPITRLWAAVYQVREDIQRAFPDWLGKDRDRFRAWTARFGLREMGIDPRLA